MDPIPLNAVWAAAANVAADTAGTAVILSLILLLMRGPLSLVPRLILLLLRLMRGLLSLMPRLILRLPLIRWTAFTVALATSALIVASTSPALPAAFGFETSGQGKAAVGPVRAPFELFHADEATLQFAQTEICPQSKIMFLGSIRKVEVVPDSTAYLLFGYLNIVILYVEG